MKYDRKVGKLEIKGLIFWLFNSTQFDSSEEWWKWNKQRGL